MPTERSKRDTWTDLSLEFMGWSSTLSLRSGRTMEWAEMVVKVVDWKNGPASLSSRHLPPCHCSDLWLSVYLPWPMSLGKRPGRSESCMCLLSSGGSAPATDHCSRKDGQHTGRVTQTWGNPGPLGRWQPALELPSPAQPKMLIDVQYIFLPKKVSFQSLWSHSLNCGWMKAKMVWRYCRAMFS